MAKYRDVISAIKPLEREVNDETFYLRSDITFDEESAMYSYKEAKVTAAEYIAEMEKDIAALKEE